MSRKNKVWTDEEIQYLQDNLDKPRKEIADYLDRNIDSVNNKVRYIKKTKDQTKERRVWTNEEYQFIKDNFGKMSKQDMARHLGRTEDAVKIKLNRLGLVEYSYHGMSNTRIYSIWNGMVKRCRNYESDFKKYYYCKGVRVCEEWSDFMTFHDWAMQNGYSDELSIDRIDNTKGYSPDNCRWATASEQSRNQSHRKTYKAFGEEKLLSEWADSDKCCVNLDTLFRRINLEGWEIERAIISPLVSKTAPRKGKNGKS